MHVCVCVYVCVCVMEKWRCTFQQVALMPSSSGQPVYNIVLYYAELQHSILVNPICGRGMFLYAQEKVNVILLSNNIMECTYSWDNHASTLDVCVLTMYSHCS